MFHHLCHHGHRRSHTILHILAWLGAFLLGWELGRQGFNLPGLNSGDSFINYPDTQDENRHSGSSVSTAHDSESDGLQNKPKNPPKTVTFTEETSGPSEQPL